MTRNISIYNHIYIDYTVYVNINKLHNDTHTHTYTHTRLSLSNKNCQRIDSPILVWLLLSFISLFIRGFHKQTRCGGGGVRRPIMEDNESLRVATSIFEKLFELP